jgi:hypothetical protein
MMVGDAPPGAEGISVNYVVERDAAIARIQARRKAERIDARARRLLGMVGWSSDADAIRRVACVVVKPDDVDAVIERALECQQDDTVRGRRIAPEGKQQMPTTRSTIDAKLREKIRDYVFHRRRQDPKLTPGLALVDVNELFGVKITDANFAVTYWRKAAKAQNGGSNGDGVHITRPRTRSKSTHTAPQVSENGAAEPSEAVALVKNGRAAVTREADLELPTVVGPPLLQLLPLSNGHTRIQADVDFDLGAALATLAAAVASRREGVRG